MRVVLIGTADERVGLRRQCRAAGVTVVGEAATIDAAAALDADADACLLVLSPRRRPPLVEHHTDESAPPEPLTPRELEVVALLAEGLPNKAMAVRLGISDQTVKFHVASIYAKLGASNRTDAVRRALRRGIVTI
jgi:DNA-binding NarL/FixJ family response regulator